MNLISKNKAGMAKILTKNLKGIPLAHEFSDETNDFEPVFIDDNPILPETIRNCRSNFKTEKEYKEHVEGTIQANFLTWSISEASVFGVKNNFYSLDEWEFYVWEHEKNLEEPYHVLAYHAETRRCDILHMSYTTPENWWIDKSFFIFSR